VLASARVLPQIRLDVAAWQHDPDLILSRIEAEVWGDQPLIVRSSGVHEDGIEASLAGHYLSILGVTGTANLKTAIDDVVAAYDTSNVDNQVFVQPMLQDVAMSGVAFNRDLSTGADYIIINYDDESHLTESVTSGHKATLKTFYCFRTGATRVPPVLQSIVHLIEELEYIYGPRSLDIEFAVSSDGTVYLFQARPLPVPDCMAAHQAVEDSLSHTYAHLENLFAPHPYLHGNRTVLGVMPDWNPAEIIGRRPHPLALSLYKELVTDNI